MLNKISSLASREQVLLTICWQGASEKFEGFARLGEAQAAQGE